jgi:hypothetical protein
LLLLWVPENYELEIYIIGLCDLIISCIAIGLWIGVLNLFVAKHPMKPHDVMTPLPNNHLLNPCRASAEGVAGVGPEECLHSPDSDEIAAAEAADDLVSLSNSVAKLGAYSPDVAGLLQNAWGGRCRGFYDTTED